MKKKFGFTIVEVMVVIAIIAILTIIIFPSINNIRAKNRDAERIADIATLELALSLYKNKMNTYPDNLDVLKDENYVSAEVLAGPRDGEKYSYVPLKKSGDKCIFYHLGTVLELPSAQIDSTDSFNSTEKNNDEITSNGYFYCGGYSGPGITPPNIGNGVYNYNVHP